MRRRRGRRRAGSAERPSRPTATGTCCSSSALPRRRALTARFVSPEPPSFVYVAVTMPSSIVCTPASSSRTIAWSAGTSAVMRDTLDAQAACGSRCRRRAGASPQRPAAASRRSSGQVVERDDVAGADGRVAADEHLAAGPAARARVAERLLERLRAVAVAERGRDERLVARRRRRPARAAGRASGRIPARSRRRTGRR